MNNFNRNQLEATTSFVRADTNIYFEKNESFVSKVWTYASEEHRLSVPDKSTPYTQIADVFYVLSCRNSY